MQFERFRFYSIPVLHDSVFKTLVLPNMKAPRKGVEEIYKKILSGIATLVTSLLISKKIYFANNNFV